MLLLAKRQSASRALSSPLRRPYDRDPRRSFARDMAAAPAALGCCGFSIRGCREPDRGNGAPRPRPRPPPPPPPPRRRSLHSDGGCGFVNRKARFVRDLDLERISPLQDVRTDARSLAAPNGCEPAYRRGDLIGFANHSFPRDKVVVAVDVDEVLGNFVSALNRFIADSYSLNHSVSEYYVYEFYKIWDCPRDEADRRVHEFFKTSYFKRGIHPIPGAQLALHKLSRFCNLSVVTSRQNAIKDHTIEWIEKHYPGLFKEIHFGNHFALDGVSRPKSDICRSLGAKVLIDDNPRYAIECAEVGIHVLLFDYENSYPWCKTDSVNQHPLVTKVHNWEEVEQHLNTLVLH